MTRLLLETLITGLIITSPDHKSALEQVCKMFTFKQVNELSEAGLDPMIVFIDCIEMLKDKSHTTSLCGIDFTVTENAEPIKQINKQSDDWNEGKS